MTGAERHGEDYTRDVMCTAQAEQAGKPATRSAFTWKRYVDGINGLYDVGILAWCLKPALHRLVLDLGRCSSVKLFRMV